MQTSVDTSSYTYFVLMNSSVRGPFLPAHWPAAAHWTTGFTSRLSSTVKLVGPTISCEGAPGPLLPASLPLVRSSHAVRGWLATHRLRRFKQPSQCPRLVAALPGPVRL